MTTAKELISTEDLSAFRARKATGPALDAGPVLDQPSDSSLTQARALRLTPREWHESWRQTVKTLDNHLETVRTRRDGTEIAGQLLNHALDMVAYSMGEYASSTFNPTQRVRSKVDETLVTIWEGVSRTIGAGIDEASEHVLGKVRQDFAVERDMLTQAADTAQREATEARRQLDAASAQLTRQRTETQEQLRDAQDRLQRERDAMVARERALNEERRQLLRDKEVQAQVMASLNRELEERPVTTLHLPSRLAALAFRAWLVAQDVRGVAVTGEHVHRAGGFGAAWLPDFTEQHPTPAQQAKLLKGDA